MQGQHYDEESGLHYNRHRYYDPMQGRYITQDPIGLRGGWNSYIYPSDPVKSADPRGLCIEDVCVVEGGMAIAFLWGMFSTTAARQNQQSNEQEGNREVFSTSDMESNSSSITRQVEYEKAKSFCDEKPEQGKNDCASLSKAIDHAKMCVSLYENWDDKWLPGRHDIKIDQRKTRIKNLPDQHRRECTNK